MSASQEEIPPPPPPPPSSQTPPQQKFNYSITISLLFLNKGNMIYGAMKMEHIWPIRLSNMEGYTKWEWSCFNRYRINQDKLKMDDAKEMGDAIKSRFGGNDESKKMKKYILKQQFEGFSVSNTHQKGFTKAMTGHFARECRTKGNQDNRRRDAWNSGNRCKDSDTRGKFLVQISVKESYANLKKLYDAQREQLSDASIEIKAYSQGLKKVEAQLKLLAEAQKEKEDLKAKVEKWHNSSKNLSKLLNTQMSANDKFGLGYGDQHISEGMHALYPPMTGNYMPSGPDVEVDDSKFTYGPKQTQPNESESQSSEFDTCESNISAEPSELVSEPVVNVSNVECQPKVWSDAPIIEEYESDSEDECVSTLTKQQETPSFANKQISHRALKNKEFVDSGCSRHMTRNKAYLAEFIRLLMVALLFRRDESAQDCFVLPIWPSYSSTITPDLKTDEKRDGPREEEQVFMDELERLKRQEKEANEEAEALRKMFEHLVIKEGAAIIALVTAVLMMGDYSLFDPTNPIHSSHPQALILGDPTSAVQTRSKLHKSSGAHAFVSYVQKQKRTNHKDFHHFRVQKFGSLVDLPYGKKAIGTKWVYRNKKDERGVVTWKPLRDLFSLWPHLWAFIVNQMDVKVPFLYGKIVEEVYVSQHTRMDTEEEQLTKTLFIKKDKHDIILVQVYVDDIIFGSTKKSWCDEFEALMKSKFQMSSMGELTFFLGLQVNRRRCTPIETQKPLVKDEEASDVDVHLYRSMIGSLMYLTASRPDIMFAVCACSRFPVYSKTPISQSPVDLGESFSSSDNSFHGNVRSLKENNKGTKEKIESTEGQKKSQRVSREKEKERLGRKSLSKKAANEALIRNFDDIKARIEADRLLAEKLQEQEREQFTIEERAKFLHDTIAAQRRFLAQQRSEAIRNRPPTKNQLRNQMMTYLKHVGNFKHAELKIKKFEEVQALYEKIKRSDEDFISIGSAEDERLIKRMNEKGVDSSKSEVIKEESKEQVQMESKEEESTRKRKLGTRKKMKSRKRRYIQNTSEDDSDKENDELRLHLTIAPDEEKEVDYEILDRKYPIKEWKTECLGTKPQTDQAEHFEEINQNVVIRSNGQKEYFSSLLKGLSIFDREDLNAVYQLVMDRFQDEIPEGVHTLVTEKGLVIHMLVEKKYPLRKEVLMQMLKLKLESEEDSTMALELIRFIKKILAELEPRVKIGGIEKGCVLNSPLLMVKRWLGHDKQFIGKGTNQNLLIAVSLPNNYIGLSMHSYSNEALLVKVKRCCCVAEKTKVAAKEG
ncbi:putative ribonuclease H-like domain-containing protein [Tanacetum coccineum]